MLRSRNSAPPAGKVTSHSLFSFAGISVPAVSTGVSKCGPHPMLQKTPYKEES